MPTTMANKTQILADLWLNYRQDEEFAEFMEYNDIALPLAYVIANGIVKSTELAEGFINEAFLLLLTGLGIDEDEVELESLEELLGDEE